MLRFLVHNGAVGILHRTLSAVRLSKCVRAFVAHPVLYCSVAIFGSGCPAAVRSDSSQVEQVGAALKRTFHWSPKVRVS